MRVSHKHKYIWISKPKTGSTSYRKLFDEYAEKRIPELRLLPDHSTLYECKMLFEKNDWKFDEYFKVCASRNPWKLLLSLFTYAKTDVAGLTKWSKDSSYNSEKLMSFEEWIFSSKHQNWFRNRHRIECYILDECGNDLSNMVFNVDEDPSVFFNAIENNCNLSLPREKLSILNTTSKPQMLLDEVADCFNSKDLDAFMKDCFSYEIELFQYKNPYS